jgi:hypothetical protein
MSISIIVFGKFWGLVALHSYQRHRVTFPIRQLCRMLSDSIGKNIERLIYASRLKRRTLINRKSHFSVSSERVRVFNFFPITSGTPSPGNPGGYIVATAADLLSLFDADFGCLSIGEEAKVCLTAQFSLAYYTDSRVLIINRFLVKSTIPRNCWRYLNIFERSNSQRYKLRRMFQKTSQI